MNLHPAKRCTIREPKKIASRGGRLSSALWILPNKNPGKINAGKKFNTGAVSESPPHPSWIKRWLSDRQFSWLWIFARPNLPKTFVPVAFDGFAPQYSGGTAPALHRTSLLSPVGHLSRYEVVNKGSLRFECYHRNFWLSIAVPQINRIHFLFLQLLKFTLDFRPVKQVNR